MTPQEKELQEMIDFVVKFFSDYSSILQGVLEKLTAAQDLDEKKLTAILQNNTLVTAQIKNIAVKLETGSAQYDEVMQLQDGLNKQIEGLLKMSEDIQDKHKEIDDNIKKVEEVKGFDVKKYGDDFRKYGDDFRKEITESKAKTATKEEVVAIEKKIDTHSKEMYQYIENECDSLKKYINAKIETDVSKVSKTISQHSTSVKSDFEKADKETKSSMKDFVKEKDVKKMIAEVMSVKDTDNKKILKDVEKMFNEKTETMREKFIRSATEGSRGVYGASSVQLSPAQIIFAGIATSLVKNDGAQPTKTQYAVGANVYTLFTEYITDESNPANGQISVQKIKDNDGSILPNGTRTFSYDSIGNLVSVILS